MTTYYKLCRLNGTDFRTQTIEYDRIGQWVYAPDWDPKPACGGGLHIVTDPLAAFKLGASIPCRVFVVRPGRERVTFDGKTKAAKVRVLSEVSDLDALFGFNYSEAVNPVHPFKVGRRRAEPTKAELAALKRWASGNSVWNSVWYSVRYSVWDSVWYSVWDSVQDSVRESVLNSVRDSVGTSVGAYVASLFPGIESWHGIDHEPGVYPFADGAYLWRRGLVPSFDGTLWRLHAGPDGRIVWEGTP